MLEEIQWHLAGAAWLVGLSCTMVHDMHVRVDVLHGRFSLKAKTWIEMLGITFLLLAFLVLALMEFIPYVMSSYQQGEYSQAPNGLPYRWILKSFLPISIILLIVASISRLSRTTAFLFHFPKPLPTTNSTDESE
jgi:TRAP-type mannitol/chloroaromatic compound transport system permease small subunit